MALVKFGGKKLSIQGVKMQTLRTNGKYQDSLFRVIFGREEHKHWLLSLYNALNDSHYENVDDLTLTTIDDVVYLKMKNDVSFLIDSQMNLFEHQSTWNPNMPLRGLFYFSQLYQEHLSSRQISLFTSALRKIPTPQFVVFYTGEKKLPDRTILKLSDAFEVPCKEGEFEWTCSVINLNPNHNKALQKNCKPLYDYSRFVEKVKVNKNSGMPLEKAADTAVDWAISENLLDGLFRRERSQIMGFYLAEFDQEVYKKNVYQDGYNDGVEEGARDTKIADARSLLQMNVLSPEQIALALRLPFEEVQALKNEL